MTKTYQIFSILENLKRSSTHPTARRLKGFFFSPLSLAEQVPSDAFWQHQQLLSETVSWEWGCHEAMQFSSRKGYGVSTCINYSLAEGQQAITQFSVVDDHQSQPIDELEWQPQLTVGLTWINISMMSFTGLSNTCHMISNLPQVP